MSLTVKQLPEELQRTLTYQSLAAGQIFQQHEPTQAFVVESGQIRLVSFSEQRIVTYYFAEAALFSGTYTCTAIAARSVAN